MWALWGVRVVSLTKSRKTPTWETLPPLFVLRLCAKLAVTFCAGTQLGWFDVGGVVGTGDFDKSCGEFGELGLWMDPKHDPEVAFVRKIASARAMARDYVAFGRLGHPPTRAGPPVPIFFAPAGNCSASRCRQPRHAP